MQTHYAQAEECFQKGDYAGALEALNALLDGNPADVSALNLKGVVHATLEQNEEAVRALDLAVQHAPHLHQAWNNRGIALAGLSRGADAQISYYRAIELYP
jgi:Flp pilus assembly protein TadD